MASFIGKFLLLAISVSLALKSRAQAQKMQCKGVDFEMAEEKVMNIKECVKDGGFENFKDVPKEKMPCISTCIMKKLEVIDENGVLMRDNIDKLLCEDLPEDIRMELGVKFSSCIDEHGAKVDDVDPMCVHSDLVGCMHNSYMEICKDKE